MTRSSAPGKLFISGEYAVVSPGNPAVLVAVDRLVTVELTATSVESKQGLIYSERFESPVSWQLVSNAKSWKEAVALSPESNSDYLQASLSAFFWLLSELRHKANYTELKISSELDSETGKKYGLGSSAALIVAVLKALNLHYQTKLSQIELLKLALLANHSVNPLGSGGDVAVSLVTGWIKYSAPEWSYLEQNLASGESLQNIIRADWPKLELVEIPAPKNIELVTGWSGSPSQTRTKLAFLQSKANLPQGFDQFLVKSRSATNRLVAALELDNAEEASTALAEARAALRFLEQISDQEIETAQLLKLIEAAEDLGFVAKTSGAGGGDCAIVLAEKNPNTGLSQADSLRLSWQSLGIVPLPVSPYIETKS